MPAGLRRRALLLAALPGIAIAAEGVRPRALRFPEDFGAHPDTRTEWWYITGQLLAGAQTYGFQVTFFRSRTDVAPGHASRFAARQLIFAHAAVTDLPNRKLLHDQRIAREGFEIARAASGDTAVKLRDWSLVREGPVDASRYRTRVGSEHAGFSLALDLLAASPPLLQGQAGFSRKGPRPEQASHYYSRPQMQVQGTLRLAGRAPLAVQGVAWMDHEWSETLLDESAVGWDWIGMNLDDGGALTAFRLRRADGSALYAGGSWRDAAGHTRIFAPDDVRFVPGRTWRSPSTQAAYPVEWRIDAPGAPPGGYRVKALLDSQELDSRGSTGTVYWEGLSEITDAAGKRLGRGYLEMTGYASRMRL